jgi:phosphosulfolactate synthase (CoM biosynthesis protein A)
VTHASSDDRPFAFLRPNEPPPKPRRRRLTEIRGPYYTPLGSRQLEDLLDGFGRYVDILKFAGGSFALMPEPAIRAMVEVCHQQQVLVSTGGFIEFVLTRGPEAVPRYLDTCKRLGFDIVEVSSGFVTVPPDDLVRLVERVARAGLMAKPEVGVQFGAGGASAVGELEAEGTHDPDVAIQLARRYLDAGAHLIMIESEGITENVRSWRTNIVTRIATGLGLEAVMFEAADPEVFGWYVKTYGPEVNLFVDHSQIIQLECLRSGIWGTKSLWGRVLTYKD